VESITNIEVIDPVDGWAVVSQSQPRYSMACPYGQPGDRLWVREAWALSGEFARARGLKFHDPKGVLGEHLRFRADDDGYDEGVQAWRPSIHMPRWASRINLEVTSIRVERLQDITQEDAKAEGLAGITKDGKLVKYGIPDRDGLPGTDNTGWPWSDWDANPRMAFRTLWAKINGIAAWDANPWLWVVEFRKLAPQGRGEPEGEPSTSSPSPSMEAR
jgi:hypothetical protein